MIGLNGMPIPKGLLRLGINGPCPDGYGKFDWPAILKDKNQIAMNVNDLEDTTSQKVISQMTSCLSHADTNINARVNNKHNQNL